MRRLDGAGLHRWREGERLLRRKHRNLDLFRHRARECKRQELDNSQRWRGGRYGHGETMNQNGHRQRGDQHDGPCGHMSARVPHTQDRQGEPYDDAKRQRPQRRFQEQVQHYRLPPFAFATLSAKVRSCRWSSMALSTMPTRTSSTDPLQNKSMIRWTALAATFPRGCVALYT